MVFVPSDVGGLVFWVESRLHLLCVLVKAGAGVRAGELSFLPRLGAMLWLRNLALI